MYSILPVMPERYPVESQFVRKPGQTSEPVDTIGSLNGDKDHEQHGSDHHRHAHPNLAENDETDEINTHGPGTGTLINVTG